MLDRAHIKLALLVGVLSAATMAAGAAGAQSAATGNPCFQVIEGQADVAPNAPLLIDRCTGETFLLARTRRDGRSAFEWVAIGKAPPGSRVESTPTAAPAPPPPVARAKAAAKDGCFTYNGRSYCP